MLRLSLLPLLGAALLTLSPLRAAAETTGPEATASTAGDSASPRPSPQTPQALLDTLLFNADTRTETVKALLASGDAGLQGLFQNLYKGNVYEYTGPEAGAAGKMLVIG